MISGEIYLGDVKNIEVNTYSRVSPRAILELVVYTDEGRLTIALEGVSKELLSQKILEGKEWDG